MALGGGSFLTTNKILNGSYFNFISVTKANANLSDRGVATMPLELNWGATGVIEVTSGDFQKDCMKIFGYPYTADEMKGLRDLFLNIRTLYAYRLNGAGNKASNDYATAKYSGIRGNDIKIQIQANVDNPDNYDVVTYIDTTKVDAQTVSSASELVDNDYVVFDKEASLSITASTPLTGGTNSTVDGSAHSGYLTAIEPYGFNAMGVETSDATTKTLYASFVKRMREEVGSKFQLVLHNKPADYEGTVNVKNTCVEGDEKLVYWVTGIVAGTNVNKSALNKIYDGEFTVNATYTQKQLENAIQNGEFTLHQVNNDIRVLADINSMVTVTSEKGDVFKSNQTIRVCDQIANDIAVLFNTRYLGVVPNDNAGRTSLWADIVKHHQQLQTLRAIQDFAPDDVIVVEGDTKDSVLVTDTINVVNAMGKLYMNVYVA